MGKDKSILNPRQERFCQLYTTYWEATRAAREAGYSPKSAGWLGYQILQNPLIKERIAQLTDHALEQIGVSRERVLSELSQIATVDISQAFDDMGQMKPLNEIPEQVRRAISAIEVNEIFAGQGEDKMAIGLAKKIRFWDKPKALELLGKHLRLFTEVHEHSGPGGKPIEFNDHEAAAKLSAILNAARSRKANDSSDGNAGD